MGFYHDLNKDSSHYRGAFLIVSLLTVGVCSMFPMMCFKNYSSKERARKKREIEALDRRASRIEEMDAMARPARRRSHSPPRTSHPPHRRRHSAHMPRDTHDTRGRRFREDDLEDIPMPAESHKHRSRYRYDQLLDRDRQRRHAPPRRYHHSS